MLYFFYEGVGSYHPFDGFTKPLDPEEGRKQGKYTFAKAPRYDLDSGETPLEVGPLARQVIAGRKGAEDWQDNIRLFTTS